MQMLWAQIRLLLRISLIKTHSVCFYDTNISRVRLNVCSRGNNEMTFPKQKYHQDKGQCVKGYFGP